MKGKALAALWGFCAGALVVSVSWLMTWSATKESHVEYGRKLGYLDGASEAVDAMDLGAYREGEGKNPRTIFTIKNRSLMVVTIGGVETLRVK